MEVIRQHAETEISELYGLMCERFLVTRSSKKPDHVSLCYLRVADVWHRFCLDAGLLFWRQGAPSHPDDSLFEDEERIDLGTAWDIAGQVIERISYHDEELRFVVENGNGFKLTSLSFDGAVICSPLASRQK